MKINSENQLEIYIKMGKRSKTKKAENDGRKRTTCEESGQTEGRKCEEVKTDEYLKKFAKVEEKGIGEKVQVFKTEGLRKMEEEDKMEELMSIEDQKMISSTSITSRYRSLENSMRRIRLSDSKGTIHRNLGTSEILKKFEDVMEIQEDPSHSDDIVHHTSIMNQYKEFKPKYEQIYPGESTTKNIYKVSLNDGRTFVLKAVKVQADQDKKIDTIIREYYITRTFGKMIENVGKVIDMKQTKIDKDGNAIWFEMLFEYGGVDLEKAMNELTMEDFVKITYQLVNTLAVMEEVGIAHLDIKPRNLVYDKAASVLKIIDFGAAISFYRSPKSVAIFLGENKEKFHEFTKRYSPPELLEDKPQLAKLIPQKIDAFCFGITILNLLFKVTAPSSDLMKRSYESGIEFHKDFMSRIEDEMKKANRIQWLEIIKQCLSYQPKGRPTFSEIKLKLQEILKCLKYPIISEGSNFVYQADQEKIIETFFELNEYEVVIQASKKYLSERGISGNEMRTEDIHYYLGSSYNRVGEPKSAIKFLNLSLKDYKKTGEKKMIAEVYKELGYAYLDLGQLEKTIESCNCALESIRNVSGGDYKESLVYSLLGRAYQISGEYETALKFYTKDMNITKKLYGEEHLNLVTTYNNLGSVYKSLGKYETAREFHIKAMNINKKVYGEEHPDLAKTYGNLGSVYELLGKYETAREFHTKDMNITKKLYGEEHPDLAIAYGNLGSVYESLGKHETAREFYIKDMNITKKLYGEEHPALAITYNNLGSVYKSLGEYETAREFYIKDMNITKKLYGEEHPDLAITYDNLGSVYESLGEYETAREFHIKAMNINKKVYGEEHPALAITYNNLGTVYKSLGEYETAREFYIKAMNINKKVYEEEHPDLATTYNNLGSVYESLGEYETAREFYIKAMNINKKVYGEEHENLAKTYCFLGSVYKSLKKYEDSINYFLKCEAIFSKSFKINRNFLMFTYNEMIDLFTETGDLKKSEEIKKKLEILTKV